MATYDILRTRASPLLQSGQRGLNPRLLAWEASALPLGYARILPGYHTGRIRAGEGGRTLDLHVGNVLLYH